HPGSNDQRHPALQSDARRRVSAPRRELARPGRLRQRRRLPTRLLERAQLPRPRGDAGTGVGVWRRVDGAGQTGRGDVDRRHDPAKACMTKARPIRIFIADDHPVVRQGLRRIVEADPGLTMAGEASDAAALLQALDQAATDLVMLDVSMPGGLFLETLQQLRTRHPSVRVLVLSVHPEDQWAVRALRAGASGYLT